MPFRNPFFFSRRALGRIDKIRELQQKEAVEGPTPPARVNNYHSTQKLTVGQTKNIHTPVAELTQTDGPAEVSNFEVNKPTVATSLNQYPVDSVKRREIQDVTPAVNGKAAPHLVHKPKSTDAAQDFFPVVKKTEKKPAAKRRTRKKQA